MGTATIRLACNWISASAGDYYPPTSSDQLSDDDDATYVRLRTVGGVPRVVQVVVEQFQYPDPDNWAELLDIRWTIRGDGASNFTLNLAYDFPGNTPRGQATGSIPSGGTAIHTQSITPVGGWTLEDMLSALATEGYLSLTSATPDGDLYIRELWVDVDYRTTGRSIPARLYPTDHDRRNSPRIFPPSKSRHGGIKPTGYL